MKKLLGLLAITPMAVTACGSADPVVEKEVIVKNEIKYFEDEKTLHVYNIIIEDENDYVGYDELGHKIKSAWAENDKIGDALMVTLHGTIGGVEFDKEVKIDTIHNDADTATAFTTFRDVLKHYYKQTENMTTYANFAKHIKDAGEKIEPTSPTVENWKVLTDIFYKDMTNGKELTVTKDVNEISNDLNYNLDGWDRYAADKHIYYMYDLNEFIEAFGVDTVNASNWVDAFTSTHYSFGNFYASLEDGRWIITSTIFYNDDYPEIVLSQSLNLMIKN